MTGSLKLALLPLLARIRLSQMAYRTFFVNRHITEKSLVLHLTRAVFPTSKRSREKRELTRVPGFVNSNIIPTVRGFRTQDGAFYSAAHVEWNETSFRARARRVYATKRHEHWFISYGAPPTPRLWSSCSSRTSLGAWYRSLPHPGGAACSLRKSLNPLPSSQLAEVGGGARHQPDQSQ